MQNMQAYDQRDNHLRLVFSDCVISLRLSTCATLGQVAQALDDLPTDRYGDLLSVDITLASEGIHARRNTTD
jgi:hypothetical protein